MYRKRVTYKDYHGQDRTEVFEFNLSDSEIMEMEADFNGSITEAIQKLSAKQEHSEIIRILKDVVLKAYGVISEDGRRFIKNDEVRADFYQTEAYAKVFTELATDDNKAITFFNRIISNDIITDE